MNNPYDKAVKEADAAAKRARRHYVTIYVRGCDTTRDCYCLNTNGYDHTEWDSPWVVDMLGNYERGGKEQPLEFPFRPGEDLEEYRIRMAKREAWDEGAEEGFDSHAPDDLTDVQNRNPYV